MMAKSIRAFHLTFAETIEGIFFAQAEQFFGRIVATCGDFRKCDI